MHLSLIRRLSIRDDADVEDQRFVSRGAHFNPVSARVDVELLEDAVELVDDPDEIAVYVHFRSLWLDFEAKRPFVTVAAGGLRIAAARIPAIPRVVPRVVITAEVAAAVWLSQAV